MMDSAVPTYATAVGKSMKQYDTIYWIYATYRLFVSIKIQKVNAFVGYSHCGNNNNSKKKANKIYLMLQESNYSWHFSLTEQLER